MTQDDADSDGTHLLKRLADDRNNGVAVVLVHALFTENLDDDLGAQIERRSEPAKVCQDRGGMPEVNDACADCTKERGDNADEDIFLLQLRTRLWVGSYVVTT